jgi:D-alanyl-D-alanine carboxypeptidase
LRYLIRAAAIKSANDAATALGEGLAGSETAFTQQMTQMARVLGMNNTQFRNAHGLTREGHYSTARDMSVLGRHLFYDFPQYYNLFSRRSADAGIAQVSATNKRFLDSYQGADGIKTGYTRAAGFNLTASAQRGNKRLIATVFGGTSTAQRNQTVAKLLDNSFARVPNRVREVRPQRPRFVAQAVRHRARPSAPAETQPTLPRVVLKASPPPATRPAAAVSRADHLASALRHATTVAPRSSNGGVPVLATSARPVPAPRRSTKLASASAAQGASQNRAQGKVSDLALFRSAAPKPRSEAAILMAPGEGDTSDPDALLVSGRPVGRSRN